MKALFSRTKRLVYGVVATALATAVVAPNLLMSSVYAAQITTRSVKISSSAPNAASVTYLATFTPATTGTAVQGMIIDFCSNDPIMGDACTAPAGFNVGGVAGNTTVSIAGQSGLTWTAASANSGRTLQLTSTGTVTGTPSGAATVTLTTVTNPSSAMSFYARIFTFAASANVASWQSDTTNGTAGNGASTLNVLDFGGVALSTSAVINVTAKVMETLAFCVYPDTKTCGNDPSFTIGHAVGTATVIDSSAVDTSITDFSLSTNASSGVAVNLKGDTLKNGSYSIHAAGASPVTFAAGTEDFGVYVSTAGTNITAQAPYTGGTGGQYGLDTTNTTTTYGQKIAQLSGPTNGSISKLTWGATANNTTPAGTYTAAEQLIATGTF